MLNIYNGSFIENSNIYFYYSEKTTQYLPNHKERNNACFGVSLDPIAKGDFDFEKNLALFNKKDFSDKILEKTKPEFHVKCSTNYKCHENILHSTPIKYRQVIVPSPAINEYITGKWEVYIM